jgi:uncharacterized FlaG/YvyC family protein
MSGTRRVLCNSSLLKRSATQRNHRFIASDYPLQSKLNTRPSIVQEIPKVQKFIYNDELNLKYDRDSYAIVIKMTQSKTNRVWS